MDIARDQNGLKCFYWWRVLWSTKNCKCFCWQYVWNMPNSEILFNWL